MKGIESYKSTKRNVIFIMKKKFIIVLLLLITFNTSAQKDNGKYEQYDRVYSIDIKNDSITDYITELKIKLENAKSRKDDFQIAENSLFLGLLYLKLNSHDIATDYYLSALKKFKHEKDTTYIIHTLRALSYVNSLVNNDSIAIKYSLENLHYCELVRDTFLLEKNSTNLGICYSNLNDEETAIKYFNKAMEFGEKIKDTLFLQRIYYDIGAFYEKGKEYDKAEYFYYKSLNTEKGIEKQVVIANIYYSISMISYNRKNFEKALSYIKKSIEIADSLYAYKELNTYYKMYITILVKLDKTKELMSVFNKYTDIQSKGYNAEKAEQTSRMKILYEIDKFESEIELLVAKNRLNESKLEASKNRLILAGIIIFLVITILVSTAVQYLKIKKSHKKIVEENIKLIKIEEKNIQLQNIIRKENISSAQPPADISSESKIEEMQNEDTENQNRLFSQVESLLETEKLYTNPDLNINTLAKKLNTNRTYLSKAINSVSGKSFIEFINEYRIAEAKRLLYSKESELITIDAIGNKAGFNSKATFFRVFKSIAGVTPNYFLKNARK